MKKCAAQGKVKYPSKRAAIRSALKCSFRRGTPLRVYFHRECGAWHLSSKVRREVDTTDGRAVA